MFRFSIEKGVAIDASEDQLTKQAITPDEDFAQRLRGTGEYREGEVYYRAENQNPKNLQEAVEWVWGILFHPPSRVWIGGEGHEVDDDLLERARKPVT